MPATFAAPAPVTAGTQYALVAYTPGTFGDTVGWGVQSSGNPYPGGSVFISSEQPPGGTWSESGGGQSDLAFKTYVAPPTLALGTITRNKKKGTATITVNVSNPGELIASGKGVKAASAGALISKSVGAGQAQLLIKAKGKKKRKLNETGKVKLNLAITYTPTGGSPIAQSAKVKLKKKLKKN